MMCNLFVNGEGRRYEGSFIDLTALWRWRLGDLWSIILHG